MKSRTKPNRESSGFTLVELLIVLGILAMLMALVAPRVLKSGEKANIKKAQVDIAAFKEVLKMYHLDMKKFPTTEQGLAALSEEPEDLGDESAWDGPYLDSDEAPRDPWNNSYQYEYPSTHGKSDYPDIWSFGPDSEDGTEDDIVNWKKDGEGEEGSGMEGGDLGLDGGGEI
jgi:general secretion pathway protein G